MPHGVLFECFGHLARSAPKSAFWYFWGKKTPKSTLWGTPSQVPKNTQKSTPWGTFRPGPLSTPVNGGRDRNVYASGVRVPKQSFARCEAYVLGCFARCETGFAQCQRLFWDTRPREIRSLSALSLSTFGHFGCFDTCTRPTGSQT